MTPNAPPGPTFLSLDVMRRAVSDDIERKAEAIHAWVKGGPEPDFDAIADHVVPLAETLLHRGWLPDTVDWRLRIERAIKGASVASDFRGFRGFVAELVELVRWALRPVPPRVPPRTPLANEGHIG